jgi:hypothetical protein
MMYSGVPSSRCLRLCFGDRCCSRTSINSPSSPARQPNGTLPPRQRPRFGWLRYTSIIRSSVRSRSALVTAERIVKAGFETQLPAIVSSIGPRTRRSNTCASRTTFKLHTLQNAETDLCDRTVRLKLCVALQRGATVPDASSSTTSIRLVCLDPSHVHHPLLW